jgi:hypothetical protein
LANQSKATKRKPAAKKRAASKRPPEPEIQVNRVTENEQGDTTPKDEISSGDERGMQVPKEGPDPDRDTTSPEDDAERPSVTERVSDVEYEPKRLPLEHAGFDHHAAEEQRQAELAAARKLHNRNTAGFPTS